ncbi:MAG: M48 family metalloprotease [Paludibacter sp.]|nr:M48 family metalloprotease [Paludibacter sp.]
MLTTTGIYFDGVSSNPQEIELKLDEQIAGLRFGTFSNQHIQWPVDEITFEHIGNSLEIRNKHHSLALIKVNDAHFATEFIAYLKSNGHLTWYQRIIQLGIKAYLAIAVLILVVIVAGYLIIIPWVSEKAVMMIPEQYDISMGHTFYNQYLATNSIDSAKTDALNKFASRLQLRNKIKLHFTVVSSTTVNAFSLPDGNIIVFTGLIDLMTDYDELAGLIGHEVSHVNNRHSMKMLCRNLSGYLFISAILSDVNGIMAIIGDNIHNLQSLSYSRQFERQADEQGTELMILNNINPKGMTDLFTRLKSSEKVTMPAFISTHPITTDRILMIKRLIKNTPHSFKPNQELKKLFLEVKN